jgi:hypothetical protein
MIRSMKTRIFLAAAVFFSTAFLTAIPAAFAEESQFAYVYTTDLLPKGAKEV